MIWKKLIITVVLLFLPFSIIAEEVQLDTPFEDDPKLYIPEDYETLREYYIELAELYQEQKYDLQQEIRNTDESIKNTEDALEQINRLLRLQEENEELLTSIDERLDTPTAPEFLNHGPLVGLGTSLTHQPTFHAGYQLQVADSLVLQVQGQYPFGVNFMVGWSF